MSHFAKVVDGVVENIIVAEQDFIDSGAVGDPSQWVQTSRNTREGVHYDPATGSPSLDQSKALRKNYAAIGGLYDAALDAFTPPRPFPSWILDANSCAWTPPVERPIGTVPHFWDEQKLSWVETPV